MSETNGTNAATPDAALDALDMAILSQLQEDGRRSLTEMAEALGVSVGTVRNRMSRLIADKTLHVIGRTDPHRVGFRAPATVHVSVRPASLIESVADAIAAFPEASYVASISGEFDLEVDLMCRDTPHLSALITHRLHKLEGVVNTKTNMILRVVKYGQPDLRLLEPSQSPRPQAPQEVNHE